MKKGSCTALILYALSVFSPVVIAGDLLIFSASDLHAEAEKKSSKKETKKEKKSTKKAEDSQNPADDKKETETASAGETEAAGDAGVKDPVIDGINNYREPVQEETSYGWLIFKTFIVLGLLAAGFWYFFKFVMKKTGMPNIGNQAMRVVAITPLGPNKSLNIVDIGGSLFLLGVTDSNINLITAITSKDEIDRIKLLSSKSTPVADQNFSQFLAEQIGSVSRLIRQATGAPGTAKKKPAARYHDEETDAADSYEYLKQQKDRLKRMNGDDRHE